MARESFEVYYYQEKRWQLHGSYEPHEREKAVEEAKQIEIKQGFASRVMRESFDEETNTSEEIVTWQSAKAKSINDADSMFGEKKNAKNKGKSKLDKKNAPAQRPAPRPEPAAEKPKNSPPRNAGKSAPKKPKGKTKKRSGLVRFVMAVIISLALGVISLIASSLVVAQMMSMGMLKPANYTQLIVGASVLIFFAALFINLQRQFGILAMLRTNQKCALKLAPYK